MLDHKAKNKFNTSRLYRYEGDTMKNNAKYILVAALVSLSACTQNATSSSSATPVSSPAEYNYATIPSKEGENCGANAGAAGNAVCDAGLTCVYNTAQDVNSKIGVCVKK